LCRCQKTEAALVRRALVSQKEPLTRHHDRASFDCGVSVLNKYRQPTADSLAGSRGPYTFRSTPATPAGAGLASTVARRSSPQCGLSRACRPVHGWAQ
jgi:hypothetical protein